MQRNREWIASYNFTADPRKEIAKTIVRCKGNIVKTAFYLGIHRSHLYRLIYIHRLWPLVNEVRKRYAIEKRRKVVRGIYV